MKMGKKQSRLSKGNDNLGALFCVAGEMKKQNGEDSYYYAAKDNKVIVSVFDGCGGIGSRRYENFSGKTGAYVASRAVCGGVKDWFENDNADPQTIKERIDRSLKICENFADRGGRLMGSLGKSFPTTAAISVVTTSQKGVDATCLWSGDSRCYMLNSLGLHQISRDDVDGEDAFSNLSDDGVLTNVITSNFPFVVNQKNISLSYPCVFFTATDGCFGYVNTPMDFEYLILETLMLSESVEDWKNRLSERILGFAGDDYTMSLAAFGFGTFVDMKNYFLPRAELVRTQFVESDLPVEEKWNLYRTEYYGL